MGMSARGIVLPSLYVATSCICLNLFRRVSYHHHPCHSDFNHEPVARREVVDWLVTDPNGTYVYIYIYLNNLPFVMFRPLCSPICVIQTIVTPLAVVEMLDSNVLRCSMRKLA